MGRRVPNLTRYLLKRLGFSVAIVVVMITLVFIMMRVSEDPRHGMLEIGYGTTPERWMELGEKLGLDGPVMVNYWLWLLNTAKRDVGDSSEYRHSAFNVAEARIPETLKLLLGGLAMSIVLTALTMAVFISRLGQKLEYAGRALEKIAPAIPIFLVGIFLFQVFGVKTGWISIVEQRGGIERLTLASVTLGVFMAFGMIRLLVPAALQVMNSGSADPSSENPTVKTAELWVQLAKKASLGLLASSPTWLLALLTAVVVTELMFGLQGLVTTAFEAMRQQDILLSLSAVTWLTFAYAAALFAAEVVRVFVDPRIRRGSFAQASENSAEVDEPSSPKEIPSWRSWPVFGRRPMIPVAILVIVLFLAIFGRTIAPPNFDPNSAEPRVPPIWLSGGSWNHVLGTNQFGRDVLREVIYGARYSLTIAAVVLGVCTVAAVVAVSAAAYLGGLADRALIWLVGFTSAFPVILVACLAFYWAFAGLFPFWWFVGLLAMLVWGNYVRRIRAEVLGMMSKDHIDLLKSNGADKWKHWTAIVRHKYSRLPKIILVVSVLSAGTVIMMESVFSFLGVAGTSALGPYNPWGRLASWSMIHTYPWWPALFSGIAIVLTVLALNFLGEWLRERYDPHPSHQQDGAAEVSA